MTDRGPDPEFIEVDEVIVPGRARSAGSLGRGGAGRSAPGEGPQHEGTDRPGLPRSPLAKLLSYILDDCIALPGTRLRIGLDPILGLIPAGGEAIASVAGAFIIGEAYRKGVSLKVIFRMGANLLLNAGVGAVPGLGDAFSAVFKSNVRNYRMLDDFLKNPPPGGRRRRIWPLVLGLGVCALALNIVVWMFLVWLTRPVWQAFL